MKRFKKGVASFYIVAFSTLIIVITVASFAAVVVSEIARTSNDDLSQSAYDAALAGVEDAKLAYANYQACLKRINGVSSDYKMSTINAESCEDIIYLMQHPNCDMVARILGRLPVDEGSEYNEQANNEVIISETSSGNNMNQAYTCVKITTTTSDYRARLSSSSVYKVVKVNLKDAAAKDINSIKFSWYSRREGEIYNFSNFIGDKARFGSLKDSTIKVATPPTVALELIQTSSSFTMEELNSPTIDGKTDRATLYLVPTDNDKGENNIDSTEVASTNNLKENLPYLVKCSEDGEFACSVNIGLPNPIGGSGVRNDDTFMFVVSLPYETPETDFAMEFCRSDETCGDGIEGGVGSGNVVANLEDMQVLIDSTGRANDLFRRVEVRMETTDAAFTYPLYAIEATKDRSGNGGTITKQLRVTKEYGIDL